jgi:hypothetical protein
MQLGSTRIGKFLLSPLSASCFCVLGLVLGCGLLSPLLAQSVKATLKICVVDEQGKPSDLKPILFNSPARLNLKEGDCYKAVGVPLNLKQLYFVAAAKEDQTAFAFAPLSVHPEDDGKEKTVQLKLERHSNTERSTIEICLSSEGGGPLSINAIKESSENNILREDGKPRAGCSRLSVAPASEYKLTLTVGGVKTDPPNSNPLVNAAILLFAVVSCGLTAFVIFRLNQLPLNTATQETVGSLSEAVAGLQQKSQQILDYIPKACSFKELETPLGQGNSLPLENETARGAGYTPAHVPVSEPPVGSTALPPPTIIDPQVRSRSDAKQRYRSFSQGQSVEHFFVMPSGASSASSMVEDAGVELREQNSGSYVAFHSIDNPDGAWAFPMPDTHFTSESFSSLFPDLSAEQYESGDIEPRQLMLLEPKRWKLSS